MASGDERAVERVNQRVLEQKRPRQRVEDGRALAQHQQRGRERRHRPAGERQHGRLRYVREEEHGRRHAQTETQGWTDLGDQRLPEAAVGEEIEDSLEDI